MAELGRLQVLNVSPVKVTTTLPEEFIATVTLTPPKALRSSRRRGMRRASFVEAPRTL